MLAPPKDETTFYEESWIRPGYSWIHWLLRWTKFLKYWFLVSQKKMLTKEYLNIKDFNVFVPMEFTANLQDFRKIL